MLRTGKQVWEAAAKKSALGIRNEELSFHFERYSMLLTQCSLLVGFAFESLVHLDVPEDTPEWIASWYFISLSAALMFGVYVVVTGSCLVVLGHQLALLGSEGDSLEQAVLQLRKRQFTLFGSGFASLFGLVSAGVALAWVKMGSAAFIVSIGFVTLGVCTAFTVTSIFCSIGGKELVNGSTKFYTPSGYFDLATLQPGVGGPSVLSSHEKSQLEMELRRQQQAQTIL